MELARIFQDGMVLQRRKPIFVWGSSTSTETVPVKINGKKVCDAEISPGPFSFVIPGQEAMENAVLEIGKLRFIGVDIGEVWIAGGQSNMEFKLQYTSNAQEEIDAANDEHLRMYTVGQYSFSEERQKGYKAWNPWDKWMPCEPKYVADFSAVAFFFAKELRTSGVPVGIVNCNWGGTSASAWLDKEILRNDEQLKRYLDDFERNVAKLDMDRYCAVKSKLRPMMSSQQMQKKVSYIFKNTFHPQKLREQIQQKPPYNNNLATDLPIPGISMADLFQTGPGDANVPGALYETMLPEIVGFTVQGVIWYQGESDEDKAELYAKLFSALISCWRDSWVRKNPTMVSLPFLYVQLAPFAEWMGFTGERFPLLRREQERVEDLVADTHMTSISDSGNVFDIHPKDKKEVGKRLALLAKKYVYEEKVQADAPRAKKVEKRNNSLNIYFQYAEGLQFVKKDFSSYNGFTVAEIGEAWLPPVLGGVNALRVLADGEQITNAECNTIENWLEIRADALKNAKRVRVEFAQTPFYQVNLYNGAGIPAKPFVLELQSMP